MGVDVFNFVPPIKNPGLGVSTETRAGCPALAGRGYPAVRHVPDSGRRADHSLSRVSLLTGWTVRRRVREQQSC